MTAIPFPTATSIRTELNKAIATYPETNVQLETRRGRLGQQLRAMCSMKREERVTYRVRNHQQRN